MLELFNNIYFRLRKNEIQKGKIRLKRVRTDKVLKILTKSIWKENIQYSVLIKTSEVLIIKLKGKKEEVIIKYHRCDMVFADYVQDFIAILNGNDVKKGVYITTGVFERGISNKRVKLEDYKHFLKYQIGILGKIDEIIKKDRLKFFKYLPS